jgi:RNase H-fold protein (predicted Holliday junction resolvase)
MILGIDPGKEKCGVAIVGLDRTVHLRQVIASRDFTQHVDRLLAEFSVSTVVIGDQTTSRFWQTLMRSRYPTLRVIAIDERHSSEQARSRYWQLNPPRGLTRMLPEGFRLPPEPWDDIVALILIERYMDSLVDAERS